MKNQRKTISVCALCQGTGQVLRIPGGMEPCPFCSPKINLLPKFKKINKGNK